MAEDTQSQIVDLDDLLSFPPEKALAILLSEIQRRANSIDGFAAILSKDEFSQEHDYALLQIERQAKSTKSIVEAGWVYLEKRGYISKIDENER